MQECQKEFIVRNPRGLHSRPGGALVKCASTFPCEVRLSRNGKTVNAKSMIGVLSLGAKFGETITAQTKGEKSEEALIKIGELIESLLE